MHSNKSLKEVTQRRIERVFPCLQHGSFLSEDTTPPIDTTAKLTNYKKINVPNKYTHVLGSGSYGDVWLVEHKETREQYAIKVLSKRHLIQCKQLENFNREVNLQRRVNHKNIIKLYHTMENKSHFYVVMEYASGGNLFRHIRNREYLSEKESFKIFMGVATAVYFLHKNHIMHRDLKPENIILTEDGNIKLCDFGCSTFYNDNQERYNPSL